ncbi:hypothetical protein GPX89_27790 [Nocardia sp. ET3-3]|uniref:YbaB/EbfC family nucleoid-associated protein n=1 Tax=Nocardia terrae TaxID=2675851 RepID=A0A7K1V3F0_9NOCA|nr:YbaB/EbfC family nucleoid-associated protein [Nocardia terrae]MVU81037.1 hypothetical protein [Nocardia terrae]
MSDDTTDLDATLTEIHARAAKVQAELTRIRGTGTAANGTITAIVDSGGRLRDLKLPTNVARLGTELSDLILQATAAAEEDAQNQAAQALRPLTSDERVQNGLNAIRKDLKTLNSAPKPRTEEEFQAADDAYYQRMNRNGWNYSL